MYNNNATQRLNRALSYKDDSGVLEALKDGANPNDEEFGMTALMQAVRWADVSTINALIRCGAKVNHQDYFKSTALMVACACAREDVVSTLIAEHADVQLRDKDGWTPLHWAVHNANGEVNMPIAIMLIEAGVDAHAEDRELLNADDFAHRLGFHFRVDDALLEVAQRQGQRIMETISGDEPVKSVKRKM